MTSRPRKFAILALHTVNITLFDIYTHRKEMRRWLGRETFTHSITLATHNPMCSIPRAEGCLNEWGKRMDRQLLGNKSSRRRAEQGWEWVAFLEGQKSEPHWHLLFRQSADLPPNRVLYMNGSKFSGLEGHGPKGIALRGLEWVAHKKWKDLTKTGDADCQRIYSNGINDYVTKLANLNSIDAYKFSPAFKTRH